MKIAKTVTLANGITMPTMGQGTWFMGEDEADMKNEVYALQQGIDAGLTLIDTAEMYANGGAEVVTSQAIAGRRDKIFLVSKVLPYNASYNGTIEACEESLSRLNTDYLDMYLLHWRGNYRLSETFEAMEKLVKDGKIRSYGVSNFDTSDMRQAVAASPNIVLNQVMYNLGSRGIEFELMPWQNENKIVTMAYSPLYQQRILGDRDFASLAASLSLTTAQLALAWVLHKGAVPIPKSANAKRVLENRAAWDVDLSDEVMAKLDAIFPPPTRKMPLDVL